MPIALSFLSHAVAALNFSLFVQCINKALSEGQDCLALAAGNMGAYQQPIGIRSVDYNFVLKFVTAVFFRIGGLVLSGHDISDGGLLTTVCEMAFAGYCGVALDFSNLSKVKSDLDVCFAEEAG